jgi:putative DNA primase/helicase
MKLISCGREDWQSYVLDLMAYCLTPDITQQRFWLYTGVGSNGKSTLAWLQRQLAPHLCHKASTSNPIVRGSGNRFSRIGYRGKFVSITDELDANTVLDSGMLKSLSGDELLRGEQKGMPEVEWRNTTKVIIQSSGFPAIYGDDGGVVRRFVAVPFEHIFAAGARDHKILDKLLTEIPAITALLLQRIPRVLSDGLREPECIRAATAHYLEEHDPGGVFFSTHVRFSPDAWVSITTLFKTYQLWAASVGRTHLLDQIGLVRQTIARSRGAAQKEKREGERGLRGVQIILDNIDIAT